MEVETAVAADKIDRKYVTRACDTCKRRKLKCDGRDPCKRCTLSDRTCSYDAVYLRVQKRKRLTMASSPAETPPQQPTQPLAPDEAMDPGLGQGQQLWDSEVAPGDPSVHAFLKKVYGHLSLMGQAMPRNLFRPSEETFEKTTDRDLFMLPDHVVLKDYLHCFFEHSNVTYRYVPRLLAETLLDQLSRDDDFLMQDYASMAMLLMVAGVGCIWYASWKNKSLKAYKSKAEKLYRAGRSRLDKIESIFPPSITALRAHVASCQLLLAMGMFNMAWIRLGSTVRLSQMIGLHKSQPSSTEAEEHSRRTLFWAIYVLDRYLSVVSGRPMAINDHDVTLKLPAGLSNDNESQWGSHESKYVTGVTAHVTLSRIVGKIMSNLYPAARRGSDHRRTVLRELEQDLAQWYQQTPTFFHPHPKSLSDANDAFYDVSWVFQRQQRTVRVACLFTTMLMYRGFLLDEVMNPARNPLGPASVLVRKCVDSAIDLATFAAHIGRDSTYNAVYWSTSHFTFCAISILVVFLTLFPTTEDKEKIEAIIAQAMEGHKRLDHSRNLQAQKFLEESRTIARNVHDSTSPANSLLSPQSRQEISSLGVAVPQVQVEPALPEHPNDYGSWSDLQFDSEAFGIFGDTLDMVMNIGFDASANDFLGNVDFNARGNVR